ncbi:MAG: hypothetical protein IMW85_02640 [Thermicanus sp.]|nr:hypothetical protein [Thermicanus sp.]
MKKLLQLILVVAIMGASEKRDHLFRFQISAPPLLWEYRYYFRCGLPYV